jgi:LmbE family N-acetylglucosaminyl deacetylase
MNVLVIAPHPDDEAIGCGGALCNHAARGDRVVVVFLTSGELGLKHLPPEKAWRIREAEARKSAGILGVAVTEFLRLPDWTLGEHIKAGVNLLAPILKREEAGLIYLPHPKDDHPDHKAAWPLLRRALRTSGIAVADLRSYEVWTPLSENNLVEDITQVMPRKLRAIRAHRSQMAEFDYARAVKGLNQFRGEIAGKCRFAEVFSTPTV